MMNAIKKSALGCLLLSALLGTSWAQQPLPSPPRLNDGIAAVVNKHVITLLQLERDTALTKTQLAAQNIPLPDDVTLRRQVLQRMITEVLLDQESERLNIRVADEQLDMAIATIAQRNQMSPAQLRQEIERSGLQWDNYLQDLRREIRNDRLRQRVVDSQIMIPDAEVDAFLKTQENGEQPGGSGAAGVANELLRLAQILVRVPEGATPEQIAQLHSRAQAILAQARTDNDFARLATQFSDGAEAASGGDLGERTLGDWPGLFAQAVRRLPAGGVSELVQSGNGFHILKVVNRTAPEDGESPLQLTQGPMVVTQTHARHILLKASPAMTHARATARLNQLRQRLELGESFEELARRYSEDASAPQGGDLGWTSPGEMVPAFEQAMQALQPGQVSDIVQTPFGWHLIRVEARRNHDIKDQARRLQARQILFQRRSEPAFEEWLSQLQGQAYIDNRLDPQPRRSAAAPAS